MDDLKTSMKEKQTLRKNTITMLRARIKQYEVDQRVEADDGVILSLIQKERKERVDALEAFLHSDRQELIDNTKEEISILESYLPEQLTDEALRDVVGKTVSGFAAPTMKDMGRIIAAVKEAVGASADSKRISEFVKANLSSQ